MTTINVQNATLAGALAGGTFTGSITYDEPAQPPDSGSGPDVNGGGQIENFTPQLYGRFTVGGDNYGPHTAGKPYGLQQTDAVTLRFEIRDGDHAPYDGSGVDRLLVDGGDLKHPQGSVVTMSYKVMIEAGPENTAGWFVLTEMHNDDAATPQGSSPPFAHELAPGDYWRIIGRCGDAANETYMELWTDSTKMVRGQWYEFKAVIRNDNNKRGYIRVWRDGEQVVDYSGPVGYGPDIYWNYGLYREARQNETCAGHFANMVRS